MGKSLNIEDIILEKSIDSTLIQEIALDWFYNDDDEDEAEDEEDLIEYGRYYNSHYDYKGYTDSDGRHYDEHYNYKGYTDKDGRHFDEHYNFIGYTDKDGRHYDEHYNYIGCTDKDGRRYDEHYNCIGHIEKEDKNKKSGCYLTTACVKFKGLSDDCMELSKLRGFRDSYMNTSDEMKMDIEKYYRDAPGIVNKIAGLTMEKQKEIYNYIFSIIEKCISLIDSNKNEEAYIEYKLMVEEVNGKYL